MESGEWRVESGEWRALSTKRGECRGQGFALSGQLLHTSRTLETSLVALGTLNLFACSLCVRAVCVKVKHAHCVQPLGRNVKRFRGGLVSKAHILLYHSTLGSRVIKKKKCVRACVQLTRPVRACTQCVSWRMDGDVRLYIVHRQVF